MQDPSHAHVELNRHEDFHSHDVVPGESAALVNSTMLMVLAIVAGLVLMALVFAWSPWAGGDSSVTPGQGGEDAQPSQQQQAPERLPQQSPR
jgi:hypothetical protein